MRADQQVCVAAGEDTFQIASGDPEVITELRSILDDLAIDEAALPGFKINPPGPSNRMWVLLGTNGGVLARARSVDGVVRPLLRHVGALSQSEEVSGLRSLFHAVVGEQGAVLVEPGLLRAQPLVEKQAARKKLALVDSSYVVIDDQLGNILPIPTTGFEPRVEDVGHVSPAQVQSPIRGVLWPAADADQEPTLGQLAHAFASTTRTGSREERLDAGVRLAEALPVTLVPVGGKNELIPSVRRILDT